MCLYFYGQMKSLLIVIHWTKDFHVHILRPQIEGKRAKTTLKWIQSQTR